MEASGGASGKDTCAPASLTPAPSSSVRKEWLPLLAGLLSASAVTVWCCRRGIPGGDLAHIGAYWSICFCLLLLKPTTAARKAQLHGLCWALWATRLFADVKHALQATPPERYRAFFLSGPGYLYWMASLVFLLALTRAIPLIWRAPLSALHTFLFTFWVHRYWESESILAFVAILAIGESFLASVLWWEHRSAAVARTCVYIQQQQQDVVAAHDDSLPKKAEATDAHHAELTACRTPSAIHEASVLSLASTIQRQASTARSTPSRRGSRQHITERIVELKYRGYQSRLAANHKVCLKLHTDLPTSALPANMAQHMQDALNNLGGPTLHVTQLSVRAGCILVAMDVRELAEHAELPTDCSQDISPAPGMGPEVASALLAKVQAVLTSQQGQQAASTGSRVAVPRATVQLGSSVFIATWQQDSQAWAVEESPFNTSMSRSSASSSSSCCDGDGPWLGLAYGATVQDGVAKPAQSATSPAAPGQALPGPAMREVTARVQVWGLSPTQDIQAWAPTPAGQHAAVGTRWCKPGDAQAGLKLLASCQGRYLTTRVQQLERAQEYARAQVTVEMPVDLLTVHHAGGASSSILLLNLELWRGELFLSESPLLAVAAPVQGAAATPPHLLGVEKCAVAPLDAWWWGAPTAHVAAAVEDVEACCEAIAAEGQGGQDVVPQVVQFLQDLALWLAQVRACAHASLACVSYLACSTYSRAPRNTLPAPHLQQLAEDLMGHAETVGLDGVRSMVSAQAADLARSGDPHWAAWVPCMGGLRHAVTGFGCHLCEQQHRAQLQPLQRISSGVLGGVGLLVAGRAAWQLQWRMVLFTLPWAAFHVSHLARLVAGGPQAQQQGTPWCVTFYLWRCLYQVAHALNALPAAVTMGLYHSSAVWALTQLCLALMEQMLVSMTLPAPQLFLLVVLLDLPAMMARVAQEHQRTHAQLLLAPFLVVAARLAVDGYLRCTLWGRRHMCGQAHAPAGLSGLSATGKGGPTLESGAGRILWWAGAVVGMLRSAAATAPRMLLHGAHAKQE